MRKTHTCPSARSSPGPRDFWQINIYKSRVWRGIKKIYTHIAWKKFIANKTIILSLFRLSIKTPTRSDFFFTPTLYHHRNVQLANWQLFESCCIISMCLTRVWRTKQSLTLLFATVNLLRQDECKKRFLLRPTALTRAPCQ